ncbi:oxidoreductase family protein [Shewanella violacea]|uniref:oxidoreductase family protein n=1 Tax=Shewanella violacea TaxID=60217 RepID=UPI00059D27BA|nr:oxidoreductase family protein [Shewanella violacea]
MEIEDFISQTISCDSVFPVETIQTLWSGYGEIVRYGLKGETCPSSIVVKSIRPPKQTQHPRGWNTSASHQRKLLSYRVEVNWYKTWSNLCDEGARVPICYGISSHDLGDIPLSSFDAQAQRLEDDSQAIILLSDLDAQGYPLRHQSLTLEQAKVCIEWLACFHGQFMQDSPSDDWPRGLWKTGSYWHLGTREDEYLAMPESPLKLSAHRLDRLLTQTRFKTLVHGDAKVANFCFSDDSLRVAAVDFQYVGGGCGMRDLVYFLGSCLSQQECDQHQASLIDYYFLKLEKTLINKQSTISAGKVEQEWRPLFTLAWADFQRFILGWAPEHHKNNDFSRAMTSQALKYLTKL